jgi:penicillin-binding protein 1A
MQVGFAAIDPASGRIRSMVGNSEMEFRYGLNHVTQIRRQPGSTFKPFVYTVAIDNGYTPAYQLPNEPIAISDGSGRRWSPRNFGGETGGIYTLRRGLQLSVNLIAIRTLLEIAPAEEVVRYARRLGIESDLRPYPSLAIGTSEVIPLELISAYGAFANEGILARPYGIERIEDRDGRIIEQYRGQFRESLSKETAYIMTSMMRSVITGGTGAVTRAYFAGPAAGKTGTTQDYADAWFIGYTPNLVAGVWTGFDDRRITFTGSYGQGSAAAAPIWGRFMRYVYADKRIGLPVKDFVKPPDVLQERICLESQSLATPLCPATVLEYVNKKYLPGVCTVHTSSGGASKRRGAIIEY